MTDPSGHHQVDIFSNDAQQQQYAELCNALYERELKTLSKQDVTSINLLQRRLSGLSHHIKRAAEHLLLKPTPLNVDLHNASWQARQAARCMASGADPKRTADWFYKHARFGLPVPVFETDMGLQHIELDSIDRIDNQTQRIHLNKHGWFYFSGEQVNADVNAIRHKRLLQPGKATLTAACCGHRWSHKGKAGPRALSLRELLLSSTINWKTYA